MANENYKLFWQEALNQIRNDYKAKGNESDFDFWFKLTYLEDENNVIRVSIPSEFMKDQIISRGIITEIKTKLKELSGSDFEIEIVIENAKPSATLTEEKPEQKEISHKQKAEQSEEEISSLKPHPDLHPNFTFDTFVPGESNNFAYSVSMAAAKNPGKQYNPILLYGGVGIGKSHLMESIGNYVYKEKKGNIKICSISAENFLNEFTDSILHKTTNKFKNKYRNLDVLLIDDIHFLQNKDSLQEEIFHTFEALKGHNAQMVFTCDRPINELRGMEDRLKTRFSSGICIDMAPPDYENRIAIIKKKTELENKKIRAEVIDYIAKNIQMNVRDLEGAINKVIGYQDLIQTEVTIEIAQDILKDIISGSTGNSVSMETILKVVADCENTSIADIKGSKRNKSIADTRHIAIYIARELLDYSYPDLGVEFGGRDHSTILSAYNKIADRIKTDPGFELRIKNIINAIKDYKNH